MTHEPSTGATIAGALAATARNYGSRLAVSDGDVQLTYEGLARESREFAAALVASGAEPGDRVAIWMFNCSRWITSALGLLQAGCVLVPINTRFKGVEAGEILRRSGARTLITVTDFLNTDYVDLLDRSGVALPDLIDIVVSRGPVPSNARSWEDFTALANPLARDEVARRCEALTPDDPSDILFTSGTTGTPKGVVMTHGRTLAVATDWVRMSTLNSDDRYLMINPYFHMFGFKSGILASVVAGAAMFPEPVFDVDRVLQRVEAEKITMLPGAPTIYGAILDHPDRDNHDLSSLRVAVTGAAEIPVRLIERVRDELPFSTVIAGYGLTEAGTATGTARDDEPVVTATTVGRARPGFELRIVDHAGLDLAAGEPGELLVRGPSVMARYLDDPVSTAEVLSDDGWLHTGDIGVLDDAGLLRIVGREKDLFIVGGFNAYPAEIENNLLAHPDITGVAVIGIPDNRLGEVGMAFVVRSATAALTGEQLIAWARDRMANYKVPRRVEFVESLPINATGKVMKDQLRTLV